LNVYILRNGLNRQFINAYDTEASAIAERSNLLKVGSYRKIDLETIEVSSDVVTALSAVKVEGYFASGGPRLTITPYNIPEGVTEVDKMTFTVTANLVSFVGYAKLTEAEISASDITSLKTRLTSWIEGLFSERLVNDNPEQVDPQPDPEPEPEPTPDPDPDPEPDPDPDTGGEGGTETEGGNTEPTEGGTETGDGEG
jgi:hypothetical protein